MLEWRNRGLADHFSEAVVALIREGPLRRTRRRAGLAEIAARGRRQLSYRNDGAIECTGTPAHRDVPPVTTGGERFVRTADMRAVIKGREADLLDALNIPWRAGNAHIRCPYPGHSDANPSWHWDRRKDRAYSTCIAGAHTALDMLMAVEEATF